MNIDTKAQHSYACFISVTRARRRQSWRECAFNLKALAIAVGGGGTGGGGGGGGGVWGYGTRALPRPS